MPKVAAKYAGRIIMRILCLRDPYRIGPHHYLELQEDLDWK